ncbi:hypothetical protein OAO00_00465 [Pelagibacteraceae bacterium]|nr:hypothetical protein [Pelagibacteraceae bacterium]
MEKNYSINEILSAVDEIQNKKKEKKSFQKDYSSVPKHTIKLIEEAEKIEN